MSTENNKPKIEALKAKASKANSDAKRRALIAAFYELIRTETDVEVFNRDLQKNICVNRSSAKETTAHASKSKKSTIAAFELLGILKNAKKVEEVAIKANTKNLQKFRKMIILKDNVGGVGEVKLTVGVYKGTRKHIQYCLTAME